MAISVDLLLPLSSKCLIFAIFNQLKLSSKTFYPCPPCTQVNCQITAKDGSIISRPKRRSVLNYQNITRMFDSPSAGKCECAQRRLLSSFSPSTRIIYILGSSSMLGGSSKKTQATTMSKCSGILGQKIGTNVK